VSGSCSSSRWGGNVHLIGLRIRGFELLWGSVWNRSLAIAESFQFDEDEAENEELSVEEMNGLNGFVIKELFVAVVAAAAVVLINWKAEGGEICDFVESLENTDPEFELVVVWWAAAVGAAVVVVLGGGEGGTNGLVGIVENVPKVIEELSNGEEENIDSI
jgi:hypothetical protein